MNSTQHTDMMRYAESLFEHCRTLFTSIIRAADESDAAWKKRMDTFSRLGLLSFRVPSPITPKPLEIDESKLDDPRYRRYLIRKLKAPRPSKFANVTVVIDRSRLSDDHYVGQMTTLLSSKWTGLVLQDADDVARFLLLKLDEKVLTHCLDKFGLHQVSGETVAKEMLRLAAEEAIDNNETYKRCVAEIRQAGSKARDDFKAAIEPVIKETLSDFNESMDLYLAGVNARADAAIAEIRARQKASSERTERILEEERAAMAIDRDVAFREAVKRREEEYRASISPTEKWIWRSVFGGFTSVVFFFMEIEGVTPAQAVVDLVSRFF